MPFVADSIEPRQVPDQQQLVMQHYPMVRSIAHRIHARLPRSVDVDDLISVGVIGLIDSIKRFDHRRTVPFETYARHRIRGAMVDALRASDWVPRSVRRKANDLEHARAKLRETGEAPSAKAMAAAMSLSLPKYQAMVQAAQVLQVMSLDAPAAADNPTPLVEQIGNDNDLLEYWETEETKALVFQAIQRLPERERMAVSLYYLKEMSLKQVGSVLGVSESRACQLCAAAIRRLKYRLRDHSP
jgi:RNA polymerase sigma factor for flagellar operon FliA